MLGKAVVNGGSAGGHHNAADAAAHGRARCGAVDRAGRRAHIAQRRSRGDAQGPRSAGQAGEVGLAIDRSARRKAVDARGIGHRGMGLTGHASGACIAGQGRRHTRNTGFTGIRRVVHVRIEEHAPRQAGRCLAAQLHRAAGRQHQSAGGLFAAKHIVEQLGRRRQWRHRAHLQIRNTAIAGVQHRAGGKAQGCYTRREGGTRRVGLPSHSGGSVFVTHRAHCCLHGRCRGRRIFHSNRALASTTHGRIHAQHLQSAQAGRATQVTVKRQHIDHAQLAFGQARRIAKGDRIGKGLAGSNAGHRVGRVGVIDGTACDQRFAHLEAGYAGYRRSGDFAAVLR